MSPKVKTHFIVPVHNECEALEEKIQTLVDGLLKRGGGSIYLVENGSKDHSWEICQRLTLLTTASIQITATKIPEAGLGLALKAGAIKALENSDLDDELFIFTAADLPFGFSDLESYYSPKWFKNGMVGTGSKQHPLSQTERDPIRRIASFFFMIFRILLLRLPLWDSQGSILAPRKVVSTIIDKVLSRDYFFSTEFLFYSSRFGFQITELPVVMDRDRRKSKVRIWRDSYRMLRQMRLLSLKNKN